MVRQGEEMGAAATRPARPDYVDVEENMRFAAAAAGAARAPEAATPIRSASSAAALVRSMTTSPRDR